MVTNNKIKAVESELRSGFAWMSFPCIYFPLIKQGKVREVCKSFLSQIQETSHKPKPKFYGKSLPSSWQPQKRFSQRMASKRIFSEMEAAFVIIKLIQIILNINYFHQDGRGGCKLNPNVSHKHELVLMDAIYKTTMYAIPLFFICIQTNVGYTVVKHKTKLL